MRIKRARYISKNIELNQEFHFSHARTKIEVNKIWNTHFTGSPLWNLFSEGAIKVESSYNKSMKCMMDLPYATHQYLIEPLSGEKHIQMVLLKRFIAFMGQIDNSGKQALKMLKNEALRDVRSTTGSNYRGIMLMLNDFSIENVSVQNVETLIYKPIKEDNQWKVHLAMEVNDVLNGDAEVEGFQRKEIENIFHHLCIS